MNEWLFKRSGRLLARPSFLEGLARALDLGATLNVYNCDKDEKEADTKALFSDWSSVGDAILDSIQKFDAGSTAQKEFEFLEK